MAKVRKKGPAKKAKKGVAAGKQIPMGAKMAKTDELLRNMGIKPKMKLKKKR